MQLPFWNLASHVGGKSRLVPKFWTKKKKKSIFFWCQGWEVRSMVSLTSSLALDACLCLSRRLSVLRFLFSTPSRADSPQIKNSSYSIIQSNPTFCSPDGRLKPRPTFGYSDGSKSWLNKASVLCPQHEAPAEALQG